MAKDWFSVERLTPLSALPAGSVIHVIGVSGVAMAQMAVALANRGFIVSGSDKEFYEPMGSFLKSSMVKLCHGYDSNNVPQPCDLVVIGNAISYGHPEVAIVEERQLPYSIFPKMLHDLIIDGRHSVVVAGTHGKTTTTGMIASALQLLNANPSFFVGGAIPGISSGLQIGSGNVSVVEGDEYDSSFFAKVPKFSFYNPRSLIVNAIEFDHADIYPNLEAIDAEFEKLVLSLSKSNTIYFCTDGAHERKLLTRWSPKISAKLVTFGVDDSADAKVSVTSNDASFQEVSVVAAALKSGSLTFRLRSPGTHNAKNAAVGALVLNELGFSAEQIATAIEGFAGVKRRQEVRFESEKITLIDDFAHHPTAVRETIAAIRQRYWDRKIIAVFEPRSNTSRRKVFQTDYVAAFQNADEVLLCLPQARGVEDVQLLDVAELAKEINAVDEIPTTAHPDAGSIFNELAGRSYAKSVILVMSNGGFGGLVQQLSDIFSKN